MQPDIGLRLPLILESTASCIPRCGMWHADPTYSYVDMDKNWDVWPRLGEAWETIVWIFDDIEYQPVSLPSWTAHSLREATP